MFYMMDFFLVFRWKMFLWHCDVNHSSLTLNMEHLFTSIIFVFNIF